MQRIKFGLPVPHLHTYMKHQTHIVHLLWSHGSSGGRTCTSVLVEIVYIVEIYSGTFRGDFTMRGYIQPIPGSSIEHAGCERLTGQRKVVIII